MLFGNFGFCVAGFLCGAGGRGGLGSVLREIRLGVLIDLSLCIGTWLWSRGWWRDRCGVDVFGRDGFQLAVAEPAGANIGTEAEEVGFSWHKRRAGGGGVEGEGCGV